MNQHVMIKCFPKQAEEAGCVTKESSEKKFFNNIFMVSVWTDNIDRLYNTSAYGCY